MIVTVFRSRLQDPHSDDYQRTAARMSELARTMPGYLSHKGFVAEDGERVTIVEYADEASQRQWALHAEHVAAKLQGRKAFYSEYKLQVCQLLRESRLDAPAAAAPDTGA